MGLSVVCTQNGVDALEEMKNHDFSLIILDLILPKMDGFTFLEKVKSNEATKEIPVLILSNLGSKADIKRAMDLGADDYLVKANHTLKEVAQKIRRYLPGVE